MAHRSAAVSLIAAVACALAAWWLAPAFPSPADRLVGGALWIAAVVLTFYAIYLFVAGRPGTRL